MPALEISHSGYLVNTAVDLSKKNVQERVSRAAIPAFLKLAQTWGLRDETARQLLGGVSNGVFYQLKRGQKKTLDQDKLTRVSLLLGIFKALNILYSRKLADAWIKSPNSNPLFEGEPPLAYVIRRGPRAHACPAIAGCPPGRPLRPILSTIQRHDTHRLAPPATVTTVR